MALWCSHILSHLSAVCFNKLLIIFFSYCVSPVTSEFAIMAVPSSQSSENSPVHEKVTVGEHLETVHTNEKVPGHPSYYEKDGLRTYGDDEDHDHEPKVRTSTRRRLSRA